MAEGLITERELRAAKRALERCISMGASDARISLSKSLMNAVGMLDGAVDKTAHALDRSLSFALFVDGKFGTFSTNRIDDESLDGFIEDAVTTVRMLQEDACRKLPDRERIVKDAVSGRELDLYDPEYETMTAERRLSLAKDSVLPVSEGRNSAGIPYKVVSEEGEYSDSVFDLVILDSRGLEARHTETSFEIGYEITVEDPEGNRFSGYWWDASPKLAGVLGSVRSCSSEAMERAAAQMGPVPGKSGKMTVVVDSEVASRLVRPLISALNGYSLQQNNSFLAGKKDVKVFGDNVTIMERPIVPGRTGSRLFDSEGVAASAFPIIENGTVRSAFINTYISGKMGVGPTVEDSIRMAVMPVGGCRTRDDVLRKVGEGLLVTGFNGGNSNSSTGAFSYGVEGFLIHDGKIASPVREILITGDFITLWNNLVAAAEDVRPCMTKDIPTLAFAGVDVSA